jgi:hypothetical protein
MRVACAVLLFSSGRPLLAPLKSAHRAGIGMALNANRYKSIPREIAITGRGFFLKKATLSARPKAAARLDLQFRTSSASRMSDTKSAREKRTMPR